MAGEYNPDYISFLYAGLVLLGGIFGFIKARKFNNYSILAIQSFNNSKYCEVRLSRGVAKVMRGGAVHHLNFLAHHLRWCAPGVAKVVRGGDAHHLRWCVQKYSI